MCQLRCVHCCSFCSRALIAGGGAPEIEVSQKLMEYSQTLTGMEAYCVRGFAEAMEVIPYTLAENAGLNPIAVVTDLRNRHAKGEKNAGINVRKVSKTATSPTTLQGLIFAICFLSLSSSFCQIIFIVVVFAGYDY